MWGSGQRPTFGNHQKAGLAIGFIAGGAVGAVIAYRAFEPTFGYSGSFGAIGASIACALRSGCKLPQNNSRAGDTAAGAVGGAAFGGLLGFFVGKAFGRWDPVELDRLTVGPGNLAVSMRIRW